MFILFILIPLWTFLIGYLVVMYTSNTLTTTKLWAKYVRRERVIELTDFQGKKTYSMTDGRYAYCFWFHRIGLILLNEDGTIGGFSYITSWKYLD